MAEKITLLDIFGYRPRQDNQPQREIEWVRFDKPDTVIEGRVLRASVRWDEDRNRRRGTLILETEDGKTLGISGTWATFVRLLQKADLHRDDYIKLHYRGTLAQLEVTDPEYAKAFKKAYENFMLFLKKRGRPIKYTKAPIATKIFDLEIINRAKRPEEVKAEIAEAKEAVSDLGGEE